MNTTEPKIKLTEKSRQILEAAIDCFSTEGYAACTTKRIAEMAQVNESTIFRTFGNKKTLMLEAFFLMTPGPEDVDMTNLTYGKDVREDLFLLIRSYAQLHFPHMPAYRLSLLVDLLYDREVYYRSFRKIEDMILHMTSYLNLLYSMGYIIQCDYQAISEYVNSLILTKTNEFQLSDNPDDAIDRFAEEYADYFYAVLCPRRAQEPPSETETAGG